MIRKFIQCKNTKERMELLAATNIADWTDSNLNTVMEIFGMKIPEGATKEDKWELIMMSLKTKEAADIAELGRKVGFLAEEGIDGGGAAARKVFLTGNVPPSASSWAFPT